MNKTPIQKAAAALIEAEKNGIPCAPVRQWIGAQNIEDAYAVQQYITQQKLNTGAQPVGKKIGLTSVVVQQQLGVDQPDFGMLFHTMQIANGGHISTKKLMQPKAEAEIAFVLKSDLTKGNFSTEDIAAAIDYAVAAIEIVGSRVENWDIRIADTIADNASASHFVLGNTKKQLSEIDLVNCTMEMSQNGIVVSTGKGSACLGSPLIATQWLANTMAAMGTPLQKGAIVLSGALGPMVNINSGDHFEAHIEGLGNVSIAFTE